MIDEKELDEAAKDIAKNVWDDWVNSLENKDQPTCNIENQDECTNQS